MKRFEMSNSVCRLALVAALVLPVSSALAQDAEPAPKSPQELLNIVRDENRGDSRLNAEREKEFKTNLAKLEQTLTAAERERARQETLSNQLEGQFRENEKQLAELETQLTDRLGTLGELFGVFRQVAGDTREVLRGSITSAEYPDRIEAMNRLSQEKALPEVAELKLLWETILAEMTYTGEISRFRAPVVRTDGTAEETDVVRVGPFNAVVDGKFLVWNPDTQSLTELERQPVSRHQSAAADIFDADPGEIVTMSIDPSRGTILGLLVSTPDFYERLQQGGAVGWVIVISGLFGVLVLLQRLLVLSTTGRKMQDQARNPATPNKNNPLGRMMAIYEENKNIEFETLELKLDEAIIKEVPRLEKGLGTLKVLSVVAPLLGLLGTVVGMIITFQQITLFGTGDPKLMAGGISTALVTTIQGLIVAIPMVLAHSFLRDRSKGLIQILEEQAAGMIARRAEMEGRGASAAN